MTKKKAGKKPSQAIETVTNTTAPTSSTTLNHASKNHQDPPVITTAHKADAQREHVDSSCSGPEAVVNQEPSDTHKTSSDALTAPTRTSPVDNMQTDQSQNKRSSLQQDRSDHCSHKMGGNGQDADASEGATPVGAQYEDRQPEERTASRRYGDDNDLDTEHSPLLPSGPRNSEGYSRGGEDRAREVRRVKSLPPATWSEWALESGLHPSTWNRQTYIKAALLATLLILIVLSFTVFRIQDHIKDVLRYIDHHKRIGAALFILSYTVACTLFLPGSLFTVGAGFLFKPFPLALAIILLGDIVACVWAFIFGRYVFHDWVKNTMSKHPKFSALDEVIKDDGWKIVVMFRLTPIPFSLITYFFSVTSIRLWTVVWATCIGVLPGSCIGIWIGTLLKGLSGIEHPDLENKNIVILVMNGVFIVCCILTLSIFGKRSLRKALKRLEQHQALTRLQEVDVVIEGVATVIHELEDTTDIPPSLRSTIIEQLAEEEADPNYYRGDLEAAQQRLRGQQAGESDEEVGGSHHQHNGRNSSLHNKPHPHSLSTRNLSSAGFTHGEKLTFIAIVVLAVLNVCVCVPLYYHFAQQDD